MVNEWVIWGNLLGAFVAGCMSFYVAIWVSSWRFGITLRIAIIFSGTLAWTYVSAYIWLLNHQDQVNHWAYTMRVVQMFAWWLGPWTILPLAMMFQFTKLSDKMREDAQQLLAEYSLETEESRDDYTGFNSRPDE